MRKINIFLPPVIDRNENGAEFVNEHYFVTEIPFPFDKDWYAPDAEFMKYIIEKYSTEIFNRAPMWYNGKIYLASLRDIKNDRERVFYFILNTEPKEE